MPVKACKSLAGTVTVRNGSAACGSGGGWARRRPIHERLGWEAWFPHFVGKKSNCRYSESRSAVWPSRPTHSRSPGPPSGLAGRP